MCNFLKNILSRNKNTSSVVKPAEETKLVTTVLKEEVIEVKPVETVEVNNPVEAITMEDDLKVGDIVLSEDREETIKRIEAFLARKNMRKVNQIAVHCTASKEGINLTVEDIDKSHKARGFKKQEISGHYCGYHFVIAIDGKIMFGRDLQEIGAHVSGYNTPSIGISYVGGLDKSGMPKDTRTQEQKDTLVWLIRELKQKLNIDTVKGHRDYSPDKNNNGIIEKSEWIKQCPCFDAIPEYKDL